MYLFHSFCVLMALMSGAAFPPISEANSQKDVDSLFQSAKDAYQHENYESAISLLTEAINLKSSPEMLCALASAKYQMKDYKGSVIACTEVINSHPDRQYLMIGYISRAQCSLSTGEYNRAISDCTVALDLDQNCKEALFARASIWFSLDNNDLALSDLDHLIQLAPEYPEAYVLRSQCYQSRNEWGRAIADVNKAIQLNDKESDWFVIRGFARAGNAEFKKALTDFEQAERLNKNNDIAVVAQCVILAACPQVDLRDTAKALLLAQKLCEKTGSKDCIRLSFLASIYAQQANFSSAIQWQQKAVEVASLEQKKIANDRLSLFKSGKPLFTASNTDFGLMLKNWR